MLSDYLVESILCYFLIGVVCAGLCSHVAEAKGHYNSSWGIAGFFLGIFALIAISGMPTASEQKRQDKPKPMPNNNTNILSDNSDIDPKVLSYMQEYDSDFTNWEYEGHQKLIVADEDTPIIVLKYLSENGTSRSVRSLALKSLNAKKYES